MCVRALCVRLDGSTDGCVVRLPDRTDWKAPGAAKAFVAGSLVAVRMDSLMSSDWSQVFERAFARTCMSRSCCCVFYVYLIHVLCCCLATDNIRIDSADWEDRP